MTDPQTVAVSLRDGERSVMTSPGDNCAQMINYLFHNPGGVSSFIEDELLSMRKLVGEYEQNPTALKGAIQDRIDDVLNGRFPGERYYSTVELVDSDEDGFYNISIDIYNGDDEQVIPTAAFDFKSADEFQITMTRKDLKS